MRKILWEHSLITGILTHQWLTICQMGWGDNIRARNSRFYYRQNQRTRWTTNDTSSCLNLALLLSSVQLLKMAVKPTVSQSSRVLFVVSVGSSFQQSFLFYRENFICRTSPVSSKWQVNRGLFWCSRREKPIAFTIHYYRTSHWHLPSSVGMLCISQHPCSIGPRTICASS